MDGDNTNSSLLQFGEDSDFSAFNNFGDHQDEHTKRRKVDCDGFVTPATPDIPKTSVQYPGEPYPEDSNYAETHTEDSYSTETHTEDNYSAETYKDDSNYDAQTSMQQEEEKDDTVDGEISGFGDHQEEHVKRRKVDYPGEPYTEDRNYTSAETHTEDNYSAETFTNCSNNSEGTSMQQQEEKEDTMVFYKPLPPCEEGNRSKDTDPVFYKPLPPCEDGNTSKDPDPVRRLQRDDDVISIPDEEDQNPVAQLMNRLAQEMKIHNLSLVKPFIESENFELLCPKRLDKILEEAHALEKSLMQQKETLRNRLQALSRTLQLL